MKKDVKNKDDKKCPKAKKKTCKSTKKSSAQKVEKGQLEKTDNIEVINDIIEDASTNVEKITPLEENTILPEPTPVINQDLSTDLIINDLYKKFLTKSCVDADFIQYIYTFPNGYQASVSKELKKKKNLWEVSIMQNNVFCLDFGIENLFTRELTDEQVENKLKEIMSLNHKQKINNIKFYKKLENEINSFYSAFRRLYEKYDISDTILFDCFNSCKRRSEEAIKMSKSERCEKKGN